MAKKVGCSKKQIKDQWVEKLLKDNKRHYNNLKTNQDQKYFIYGEFGNLSGKYGVKIKKMPGSNQVIAYVKGKQVYFSDDGKLSMKEYKKVLAKMLAPLDLHQLKKCR